MCSSDLFSHADAFGSAPAHRLTERVRVNRAEHIADGVPRSFGDYVVSVDDDGLPSGVSLAKLFS